MSVSLEINYRARNGPEKLGDNEQMISHIQHVLLLKYRSDLKYFFHYFEDVGDNKERCLPTVNRVYREGKLNGKSPRQSPVRCWALILDTNSY